MMPTPFDKISNNPSNFQFRTLIRNHSKTFNFLSKLNDERLRCDVK